MINGQACLSVCYLSIQKIRLAKSDNMMVDPIGKEYCLPSRSIVMSPGMRPNPSRRSQGVIAPNTSSASTSVNSHFSTTVSPPETGPDYTGAPGTFD